MAPKKLIIFLVLLWTMHHYRAKRIIKAKYRETKVVNYKHAVGIQYKYESKEDIAGFICKPVARPEYGKIYYHKGML